MGVRIIDAEFTITLFFIIIILEQFNSFNAITLAKNNFKKNLSVNLSYKIGKVIRGFFLLCIKKLISYFNLKKLIFTKKHLFNSKVLNGT